MVRHRLLALSLAAALIGGGPVGSMATASAEPVAVAGRQTDRIGLYGTVRNSREETKAYIDQCKKSGVGLLLPSLSGGGTVIFKTDKAQYYPSLQKVIDSGYDPLADLIEQAHAAGIKVVPSVAIGPGGKILEAHPEWETRDRTGRPSSATCTPTISFAYPQARAAKIAVLMDLVNGYDIDGVLLDYCRYPENSSSPEAKYGYYGYDAPLIDTCRTLYGFDPAKVEIDSSDWNRFNALRAGTVTAFVKEFRDAVKASGKTITVDGFGDTDPDLERRMCGRDWGAWGREGLIDTFYLATYQEKPADMARVIKQARDALGDKVRLLPAVTPFNDFVKTRPEMVAVAKAQLAGGADGLWIYRDDSLDKNALWGGIPSIQTLAKNVAKPAK